MQNPGSSGKLLDENQDRAGIGALGPLSSLSLVIALLGALGSAVLTYRSGTSTQPVLRILFVFWVLAPFAVLIWANRVSVRWSAITRLTLFGVTVLVTLIALAAYANLIQPPAGSAHAFVFVVVPPVSILLLAVLVPAAAWISRSRAG